MTEHRSRPGHSDWVIAGIAIFAVIALVVSLLIGIKRYGDLGKQADKNTNFGNRLHTQQLLQKKQQQREDNDVLCIAMYTQKTNRRNQLVNSVFVTRNRAFHTLVQHQLAHDSRSRIDHFRRVYLKADTRYLRVSGQHPVVPFHCADRFSKRVKPAPLPHVPPSRSHPGAPAPGATSSRSGGGGAGPKVRGHRGRGHSRGHQHHGHRSHLVHPLHP